MQDMWNGWERWVVFLTGIFKGVKGLEWLQL